MRDLMTIIMGVACSITMSAQAEEPLTNHPATTAGFSNPIVAEPIERPIQLVQATTPVPPPALPGQAPVSRIDSIESKLNDFIQKQTATTYPTVKVNGVFQADTGFFTQDPTSLAEFGRIQNGAAFRRARLAASGSVTDTVNYFFQMDFAFFGRPTFTDVWLDQTQLPLLGNARIGQWKQPFSLEVVSSFRYTTFIERSLLFQAFTPFRHIGAGFYDHADDLSCTWAASAFRGGQDQFGDSISTSQGWACAERFTWCPYYDEPADGRYYLHLGFGHYMNAPPNKTFTFRTIPEFFVGENAAGAVGTSGQAVPGASNGTPFFLSTGAIPMHLFNVIGTELMWVNGPFSLQSEAMVNFVDRIGGANLTLPGAYMQAGYFLTGEHRPYDRRYGVIDRIRPFTNFFRIRANDTTETGWGAWEVATRVSYLNLNDQGVHGGSMADFTAGINWFWNPYTKLVFNYINAQLSSPTFGHSSTHIFGAMAQIDF